MLPGGENLSNVIVKDEGYQHHDEHEANLEHGLFDRHTHIAAHHHFDDQHYHTAAIQDGERHQVDDGQIQADHGHEHDERGGSLPGGLAGHLRDADRSGEGLGGNAAFDDAFKKSENQTRAAHIFLRGFRKGGGEREARGDDI